MKLNKQHLPIILLLSLGIICRWLPHPANFAPIGAIAIFGGIYLPKKWTIILPLIAMLVSDIFIGFYNPIIMIAVYFSFLLMGVIGLQINRSLRQEHLVSGIMEQEDHGDQDCAGYLTGSLVPTKSGSHCATLIRKNKKFPTILGGTVLGSLLFFLITNWFVWAFGTMYAHNLSGLLSSYYLAIPFFRNSLLGNLFYTAILVGGLELILYLKSKPFLVRQKS